MDGNGFLSTNLKLGVTILHINFLIYRKYYNKANLDTSWIWDRSLPFSQGSPEASKQSTIAQRDYHLDVHAGD